MDPLIILVAFGCGFIASQLKQPPLVGYLIAGFWLSTQGYETGPIIHTVAEIGVTVLLFSIGLKLKIKDLFNAEIWAGASLHLLISITLFSIGIMALAASGLNFLAGMEWQTAILAAFALSFSSTVFAIKILDENGRAASLNGRTAIGVLIMQDIFAVLFMTFSTGKLPSLWAIAVLAGLPVARWLFMRILDHIGHGELQVLFGFFLAFVAGAEAFEIVGIKADLGALIMGILLAPHQRAGELADSLMNIKDFLLIGFFLEIGLSGLPTLQTLGVALLLILVLPIKSGFFFLLFTKFKLKARTAFISALNLSNYSEFGLIVGALAVSQGWLPDVWLQTIALALSISFLIASPFNKNADALFESAKNFLKKFESTEKHEDEKPYELGDWQIAIMGMGRVGTGAYDYFREKYGPVVIGLDFNAGEVKLHQGKGRNVTLVDVTDPDFWDKICVKRKKLGLIILTIPSLEIQLHTIKKMKARGFNGEFASVVHYDDEVEILREAGVNTSFNIYDEAGIGLASHVGRELDLSEIKAK
ncbi:cation:proton antiporter [Maridesulfovibrio sp.]|uniref:cation:proton antiporter domain-containing protein n=1 Tax=Maridesulfovibrio sp. TaxID=2795000 RepID=UPI003BAC4D84